MDRAEDDMKLVGFLGIFKHSFKTIFSRKKLFTQITLSFILPLTIIFFLHMILSRHFFHRIENNTLPYNTNDSRQATPLDWLYYALFTFTYFIFLTIFSLLSTASVVFTVASIYTGRDVTFLSVLKIIPKIWKRLCITFISIYFVLFIYDTLVTIVMAILRAIFGYTNISLVIMSIILILFVLGYLYLTVICQLASVVTVLENVYGCAAMSKGPLDHNVLYLGEEHRARKLWMEPEWGLTCDIDVKRGEGSFWDAVYKGHIYMADGVMNKVAEAGFKGVFDCGYQKIDRALIQALIERWRPETNTFHLPIGEVTVTLEDVGILWGLPVEGEPVTLSNNLYDLSDRIKMCRDYLGFTPLESDFKRHTIKISSILQHLMSNPLADEGADEEQYANQARCIILILCSSTLFADKSNAFASLSYLYNIRDIKNCGGLSWGSAALSCLYRELSKGTNPETIAVGGPMSLLQLWAWTRILPLAPRVTGQINIDPTYPYGARWDYSVSHKQSPSHVLLAHRTSLQNLLPNQFDWMPYRNVIHTLPQMCTSGMQSWMSQCYLIFWATIEYHPAERVMRQFGLVQTIPRPFPLSKETQRQLRKLDRTGRADMDWSQHHHFYINEWRNRHQYLVRGALSITPTVDPQYNGWFNRITVLFVRNPNVGPDTQPYGFQDLGGTSRLLVQGLSYIGQEIPRMRNMGADNYYHNFSALENMTTNIMGMVGQSEAIKHHPHIQTDPVNFETDDTIPQRARRRPSTRGRRGSRDNNQNIAGPSSYQENRQNFGEGTSSFQVGQSNVYRPSFEHFGEGTSNFGEGISNYQQGTSLNVNDYPVDSMDFVSSLFDYQTPQQNIIRGISPNQSQHFQQLHQFQYTGDNEQQPRFRSLSPVHLELGLQLGQPEEGHEYQPEQVVGRRRQPPRNAGPPGCGTNDHHYTRHNRR